MCRFEPKLNRRACGNRGHVGQCFIRGQNHDKGYVTSLASHTFVTEGCWHGSSGTGFRLISLDYRLRRKIMLLRCNLYIYIYIYAYTDIHMHLYVNMYSYISWFHAKLQSEDAQSFVSRQTIESEPKVTEVYLGVAVWLETHWVLPCAAWHYLYLWGP